MSELKDLAKTKTFWTGLMGALGAAGAFFTGTLPAADAIQIGLTGLIGIFLRSGVAKNGPAKN